MFVRITANSWRRFVDYPAAAGVLACLIVAASPLGTRGQQLLDSEYAITDDDREHWSFQPLTRPPLPEVSREAVVRGEVRGAIDHFIAAEFERRGLRPLPRADRRTLIRRVTYDLTGLPPKPAEVEAFLADPAEDAYERLVDRLLASPAHGEHAAQFWLDLARFAETDGFEHDKVRAGAWRYRDWVIDAFNRDLPYDRFLGLQLAGDELRPDDEHARIATMFCLAGPDMPDINSQEERRHNLLNELTGTVGSALLGLQLGCAQCHDHKYDPLSQGDFYRLRAVFEPAVKVERNKSVSALRELGPPTSSHLMLRGDWRRPGPELQPAFPRIANPSGETVDPAAARDDTSFTSSGRRSALVRWLTQRGHPLTSRVLVNRLWQQHFGEGLSRTPSDFGVMGDEPSHPELLDWLAVELERRRYSLKAIRRLIVTSAVYCRAGRPPEPAGDSSGAKEAAAAWADSRRNDAPNYWLARYPRRRLRGETLRDAMLSVSDSLQHRQGGPGVMPPLPPELVATLLRGQWETSSRPADHYRRSIYIFARRNLTYPVFDVFDRPAANASCARRARSTTAPQALQMLNSRLSLDAARRLAGRVLAESSDNDDGAVADAEGLVARVYQRALARNPDADEFRHAQRFLERQEQLLREEQNDAWKDALPLPCPARLDPHRAVAVTDLCLAVLNANEFLYVD